MRKNLTSVLVTLITLFLCISAKAQPTASVLSANSTSHPAGTINNVLLTFSVTAGTSAGEDIRMTSVSLSSGTTFQNASIYDAATGQHYGFQQTLAQGTTIFSLPNVIIPQGTTKTFTLRADIPSTCQGSCSDISLSGVVGMGVNTATQYSVPGLPSYGTPICITHPVNVYLDSIPAQVCQSASITPRSHLIATTSPAYCGTFSYTWNFGYDASTQTYSGQNPPSISYTNMGMRSITLVVTDTSTGYSQQGTYFFMVMPQPQVYIQSSGPNNLNCLNDSVALSIYNNTNTSVSLKWFWNGAQIDTVSNIYATQPGLYSLVATSQYGCVSSPSTTTIYKDSFFVRTLYNNSSIPDSVTKCPGQQVYVGTYTGNYYVQTFQWNTGDVTSWLNTSTPGTYTITATNGLGCTTSDTITITDRSVTQPIIVADGPLSFCPGGSVKIHTAPHYSQYNWNSGNYMYGDTFTMISWTGQIAVTVTDSFGCNITSNSLQVTQLPSPTTPGITPRGCNLVSNVATGNHWYLDNISLDDSSQTITPTSSGEFSIVTVNSYGCTATSQDEYYEVPALPEITVNGPTVFCNGGHVLLTASAGNSWVWSNGDTTESTLISTSGIYTATVTHGTCSQTASPIQVIVNDCTTGINDLSAETTLSLFPNPALDKVQIQNLPDEATSIELLSVTGQQISSQPISHQSDMNMDVSFLSSGIYFVKIGSSALQFIKE